MNEQVDFFETNAMVSLLDISSGYRAVKGQDERRDNMDIVFDHSLLGLQGCLSNSEPTPKDFNKHYSVLGF